MKFIKEWYDKTTNQYVFDFEATQDEYNTIQEYCKQQNKTLDALVDEFLKGIIEQNKKENI